MAHEKSLVGITFIAFIGFFLINDYRTNVQKYRQPNRDKCLMTREEFDRYLERWIRINGRPEKLLSRPNINTLPTAPNGTYTKIKTK